jgi:hypothetical protein
MSEEPEDIFDFRLWLAGLNISAAGIKKLERNEISDRSCLLQLTLLDITQVKLGVGDRRRLIGGVDILRKIVSTGSLEQASSSAEFLKDATSVIGGEPNPPGTPPVIPIVDGLPVDVVPATPSVDVVPDVTPKTSYSIEEVSSFLAGSALPANLQASVAQVRQSPQVLHAGVISQSTLETVRPPFLPPHFPPLSVNNQQQHLSVPPSWNPSLGLPYNNVSNVSPHRPAFVPNRLNSVPRDSVPRDSGLLQYTDYHSASLHDLLSINEHNQNFSRQGESLFLPCNFVSHVRGSTRSEDEELLTTVNGSKLYLSNANQRKVAPEKLSYGLFFGANARILARLIPNLTPDLAAYLDYLRKLGDLMVNYTSSSVFLLDHVHRFEVVEEGKTWNYIDPSLSMNILKKRDVNVSANTQSSNNFSRNNTVSRVGQQNSQQTSQRQQQRSTTVICWLFNQHEGCSYGSGCRFLHICNIVACGLDHPAYKHIFRSSSQSNQQSTSNQSQVAKQPAK